MLTAIIACLTLSFFISPSLHRFSISSEFVDPEQYHAIVVDFLVVCFSASDINLICCGMQNNLSASFLFWLGSS